MTKIGDYNTIMSDHNIFNQIVYTPLSEAIQLLDERRKDLELVNKIENLLKGDIPEILKKKKCAVLSRQIATPNYESRRFVALTKENDMTPVFFEYHHDKFTPENQFKYSLGKIVLYNGVGKWGGTKNEYFNVIDFNKSNGKKISEVSTISEGSLVDFHKNLFKEFLPDADIVFLEGSEWYKNNGSIPELYYEKFLLMFLCHGILFENFLLEDSEGSFTKGVILPALEEIMNLTGLKPLIVPLEPFDMEQDGYWYHHDYKVKNILIKKH